MAPFLPKSKLSAMSSNIENSTNKDERRKTGPCLQKQDTFSKLKNNIDHLKLEK